MQLSNQKSWAIAACITALVVSWDFSNRIMISNHSKVSNTELDMSYIALSQASSDNTDDKIIGLYAEYDKPVAPVTPASDILETKKSGMTAEQMKNQEGRLDKFFIGDYTYVLSGVFFEKSRFAVLLQTSIKTNKVKEIKVSQGENIGEYLVDNISEKRIVFSEQDRKVELSIF
ncbi:hypothetical protein Ssed_3021 [Shewanella sediminis HAW-EB3]|uniref:Uncharacterized protein n=1 Tax=Shewanella sediminis (strain HAW-EB3) TaxID=425104 RepID=A8FXQ2_SHESH|nr:hypothetical protein [Shewanella sediminis]ABV37625.1 hypothetical protein Ssed_3021 [Shewanella sediminis HAW-EB3]